MKISYSKKLKHLRVIKQAVKVALLDHDYCGLVSLDFCVMPKKHRHIMGGNTLVKKDKGKINIAPDMSKFETALIVAHEMVHISQYATGKIVDNENWTTWNGWLTLPDWLFNVTVFGKLEYNPFYWLNPWEREARAYEKKIREAIE